MFSKGLDVIARDSSRLFWVRYQVVHLCLEIGEIALNLYKVLLCAVGNQKVMMMLNPLHLMYNYDRVAELPVFQGSGVAST